VAYIEIVRQPLLRKQRLTMPSDTLEAFGWYVAENQRTVSNYFPITAVKLLVPWI
jgi:hypothetical protein